MPLNNVIWIILIAIAVMTYYFIRYVQRALTSTEKSEEQTYRMQIAAIGAVYLFGALVGLLAIIVGFPGSAAVLALLALGLTAAGAVVGFLFGVPKSAKQPSEVNASSPSAPVAGLQVNTNLDRISDWLTTVITGLALTQLIEVPNYVNTFSNYIAPAGVGSQAAHAFAVAMMLYFPLLGFFTAYVATRVVLSRVFESADEALSPFRDEQKRAMKNVLPQLFDVPREPSSEQFEIARAIVKTPYDTLKTADDRATWGRAQAILNQPSDAAKAFKKALEDDPSCELWQDYAYALYQGGNDVPGVLSALEEARTLAGHNPHMIAKILANEAVAYLYMDAPEGYERSLNVCNALLGDVTLPKEPATFFYRACANGQRYTHTASSLTAEDAADIETQILADTIETLFLDPDFREEFRRVAVPHYEEKDGKENDLEIFARHNAQFRTLIGMDGVRRRRELSLA